MKLRHTAALALTGWYLMLPPTVGTVSSANVRIEDHAPFSQWEILDSFDAAKDCAQARGLTWKRGEKYPVPTVITPKTLEQLSAGRDNFATCVATDDPRLKGK